jgi:tetratricopeptide (TPR) repeat protein
MITAAALVSGARASEIPDSLLVRGDSLYQQYQNAEALRYYRQAYLAGPTRYEPLFKMTRAYNDVGEELDKSEARRYFEQAITYADTMQMRFPDSMQSYFLMAAAAGNLAQISGGNRKLELSRLVESNIAEAIELDPEYSPAHVIQGSYYREIATANQALKTLAEIFLGGVPDGTLEDSYEALQTALRLDSLNMYAHMEMARTLLAMDQPDAARDHLRAVLELPIANHYHPELKRQARELLDEQIL